MKKLSLKGIINWFKWQRDLPHEKPEFDIDKANALIKENYPQLKDGEYGWCAELDLPHWCWVLNFINVRSYVPELDHWNNYTIKCKFYI